MPTRRFILQATAALTLSGAMARRGFAASPRGAGRRALFVGARGGNAGVPAQAMVFDAGGEPLADLPLPSRGHGFAAHPVSGDIVAFARRPGTFAVVFDPRHGQRKITIEAAEGRRFCGHGLFARGGALLVATELDHASGDGRLGLYDVANGYRRIGEYRCGGLDPHEALLLSDGNTLAVANGGILTDPEAPGVKLNRDRLESSLAYIDLRDGAILAQHRLAESLAQLSLRHMAMNQNGLLAIAMQYEGASGDRVPLVVTHRPGERHLEVLAAPERDLARLRNYCGSVAYDVSGRYLAVTSPVGGIVAVWDIAARELLGVAEQADVCGLAAGGAPGEFIVTSGLAGPRALAVSTQAPSLGQVLARTAAWDNHLLRLT